MTTYDILTGLESSGGLRRLVAAGIMPVKIGTHLEIYRLVDMRVKTGSLKSKAVVEAAEVFHMCERSVYRVIRGLEK